MLEMLESGKCVLTRVMSACVKF